MNNKEIENKFSNRNNSYLGHGIGGYSKEKVESIFNNGLRCSHEQLSFTTISLGEGSENLFKENFELMNNWKHKDSKYIMIASIPTKFRLLDIIGTSLYGKQDAAFYNQISQEEAQRLDISEGYYLKPEFIMGMYDANNNEFISNERYYENLKQEEQDKLFNNVKSQYINLVKDSGYTFKEYSNMLEDASFENPLSKEEIEKLDLDINNEKFIETINAELLKKEVKLPNGMTISAKKYLKDLILPLMHPNGTIMLKNGAEISSRQYIEEYVLGEGQTKYEGDIKKLFKETIFNEKEAIENIKKENTARAFANVGTAAGIATGDLRTSTPVGAVAGMHIKPQTIGKATIGVSTTVKKEVMARETEEKVNNREGEELDDN